MSNILKSNHDCRKLISAIANVFHTCMLIRLKENDFEILNTNEDVKKYISSHDDARGAMILSATKNSIPLQREDILAFTNLDTLSERIKAADYKLLGAEFIAIHAGWVRICFLPVDIDKDGNVASVLFTVQKVHHNKTWNEKQNQFMEINEVTGMYNLTAYSRYIVDYALKGIPDNLVFIDVILKIVGKREKKEQIEEKLRYFATDLVYVKSDFDGYVFQVDKTEFIYVLEVSTQRKEEILRNLSALKEKNKDSFSFAYGVATQETLRLGSVEFLAKYAKYEAQQELGE